jgi:hypothetical protein
VIPEAHQLVLCEIEGLASHEAVGNHTDEDPTVKRVRLLGGVGLRSYNKGLRPVTGYCGAVVM